MTSQTTIRISAALLAVVLLGLAGCARLHQTTPSGPATSSEAAPSSSAPPAAGPASVAREQLAGLPVIEEMSTGYDRDLYGPRWSDIDSNGCNQRDDRLLLDAVPGTTSVAVQDNCDHDVLAGQWIDPYTGEVLAATDLKDPVQAQAITIDHIVALAEAHASGGYAWTPEQRLAFANTVDQLRVVGGGTNSAKSDQDPAEWLPMPAAVCWYAATWIAIKAAWDLSIDAAEALALDTALRGCP